MLKFIIFLFLIFNAYSTLFAASPADLPLINEQQRQIYERLRSIDTTIPSSEHITPESNLTNDKNETICFKTTSISIKNMTLLSRDEQNLTTYTLYRSL